MPNPDAIPPWLIEALRTDHAGETGAVWIYRGILAVSADPKVRAFARDHLETERNHLNLIADLLPETARSQLLFLWRPAGFLTGAIPALFGPRAVYRTIAAVETFVDRHYAEQIQRLDRAKPLPERQAVIQRVLIDCQADEIAHRDEAALSAETTGGVFSRLWCAMVAHGSNLAVAMARRL